MQDQVFSQKMLSTEKVVPIQSAHLRADPSELQFSLCLGIATAHLCLSQAFINTCIMKPNVCTNSVFMDE